MRTVAVRPALSRHIYAIWRADADRRAAVRAAVQALQAAAVAVSQPPRRLTHTGPASRRGRL